MKVSVLMPAYNAASTVGEALNSLAGQTFADFEVVLVDDGSDDGTADVAASHWGSPQPLRLLRGAHEGLVTSLNRGLAACRGDVVARMDADDICHPKRLEKQLALMATGVEMVGCQVAMFAAEGVGGGYREYERWQNDLVSHDQIAREMYVESPLAHPTLMVRRTHLEQLGGYADRGWAEDYDLWLRAWQAGLVFGKVASPLLRWRDWGGRHSRTHPRYRGDAFIACKAHYLAQDARLQNREVLICGGPDLSRKLGRLLIAAGIDVAAFVDIAERRVGGQRQGRPVIAVDDVGEPAGRIMLAAVARRGVRQQLRAQAQALGFAEGRDFLCVA